MCQEGGIPRNKSNRVRWRIDIQIPQLNLRKSGEETKERRAP